MANWPHVQGNNSRTACADYATFADTIAWEHTFEVGVPFGEYILTAGQPVVSVGGYVWVIIQDFAATRDYLMCFNSAGTVQSKTRLLDPNEGDANELTQNLVTTATDQCIVTFRTGLRCFQTDGTEDWSYDTGAASAMGCASPCVGSDGRVWFMRYSATTGKADIVALTSAGVLDTTINSPQYPPTNGSMEAGLCLTDTHVYTIERDTETPDPSQVNSLAKWDISTGLIAWRQDFTTSDMGNPFLAPSIYNGHCYLCGESRSGGGVGNPDLTVCVNDADGTVDWVSPFMSIRMVNDVFVTPGWDGPPVDPVTGYIFVAVGNYLTANDRLVALDPADGTVVWTYTDAAEGQAYGNQTPVIGNDGYLCIPMTNLLRIKISDGSLSYKATLTGYSGCIGPALSEDYVYVGANDGVGGPDKLFALNLAAAPGPTHVYNPFGSILINVDKGA